MSRPRTAFDGRIIFDHLQKTAGQAVNAWLIQALGEGCVTPNLIGGHRELIQRYGGSHSIISGHISFNFGEQLDPRYFYLTILRDPVDRCISWTYFLSNNVPPNSETLPLIEGARLFVDSAGAEINEAFQASISNLNTEHFCRLGLATLGTEEEKLASAKRVLDQYDVVGIYENMPEFLDRVSALIGINCPAELAAVNVTSNRPAVDDAASALRLRIEELNPLDVALYEYACSKIKNAPAVNVAEATPVPNRVWLPYASPAPRSLITADIELLSTVLREGDDIECGQVMSFDVDFFATRGISELEAGIHIFDADRQWVFGTNSILQDKKIKDLSRGTYRVTHHVQADFPAGSYTAGFAFAERSAEGTKELAWHHAICSFTVRHPQRSASVGYSNPAFSMAFYKTPKYNESRTISNPPNGFIRSIIENLTIAAHSSTRILIEISNDSSQLWLGDAFRPVSLSYHWLTTQGERVVWDGERTPLPPQGIVPGQQVQLPMVVRAPEAPGQYQLQLTLVQERVGWFEELSENFIPATLTVEVVDASAAAAAPV
jgi:hypothetical protein